MWRPILTLPLALALAGCLGEPADEQRVSWVPEDRCVTPDCSDHTSLTGKGTARVRTSFTELPSFDIKATCHASVTFQSSEDDRYCLADERAAEKQLRAQWAAFQPTERQSCVEQSASLQPSYVETLTCLEMSKETKARAKTFTKPPGSGVDTPAASPASPPVATPAPRPDTAPGSPAAVTPTPAPPAPTAMPAPPVTAPTVPDASPRPEFTSPEPPGPEAPSAAPAEPWPGLDDMPKAEPPR